MTEGAAVVATPSHCSIRVIASLACTALLPNDALNPPPNALAAAVQTSEHRNEIRIMRKYITEFIGTFFLVLTVGCSVVIGGAGVIAPLAIGSALMIMIFAGGHISGGHYNPAVTLGIWLRRGCPGSDVAPYCVAQLLAAVAAALAVNYLKGEAAVVPIKLNVGRALLVEFLFTFALVYVVLNVATAKANMGNSFYGLAIGFTVLTGAFAVGGISGAAFNPAVAVGISVMGLSVWSNIWIYLLSTLSGAVAAASVFNFLNPEAEPAPK